ncbi:squalene/phytoene synthase family protein [Pseudooceanicola sp. HF7]|uniref:squalene/phytoene synthase family protein n=1 Tax=Pseudooceanicola sp. HF7 TaxID=2721560 RepID=UPI00142F8565|nr:squalene/phytoene synthase family protein [Pseudooceanicola sp. HF7]
MKRSKTAQASAATENFPVASLLIRRDLRPSVMAFYAFARAADDIADDPTRDTATRLALLERCEAGLDGDPSGSAEGLALHRDLTARDPALLEHPRALLTAFRQDSRGFAYQQDADLLAYCRHSADPVGRFLLALHGEDAACHGPSDALCTALQILNHLQDIAQDKARLDRCYLPGERLSEAGVTQADLTAPACSDGLRRVIDGLLDLTDGLLLRAAPLPRRIAARGLAGEAATILWLARDLSARLRRGDPLARRIAPSPLAFLRAGLTGGLRSLRPGRPRLTTAELTNR